MFPILWILKLCGVGDGLQKILAPVIAVAVVAAAVWAFYGYAKHEGAKPYIAEIAVFKAQIEANERLTKLAQKNMQEGQETIVKELKEKLVESEAKKQKTLTIKVKEYVTEKADAKCVVTDGFVELFNKSLSTEVPITPVSTSGPGNVDEASGIKISEVASTIRDNDAECVQRGEVIDAWQTWYGKMQEVWEKYREAVPELPPIPK